VIVSTVVGLLALVVGLVIGWPVLVALSIIFTIVQLAMVVAKTAVQRNDVRIAEQLAAKEKRHRRT
tara:strand:+ start:245 stop:442 length:198 start_codon:yes stop_codon:yes gene_type:complete